jgi:hypothetical protein
MQKRTSIVPRSLVREYIKAARAHATSPNERDALAEARALIRQGETKWQWNIPVEDSHWVGSSLKGEPRHKPGHKKKRGTFVGDIFAAAERRQPKLRLTENKTVAGWNAAVLKEIHTALCTGSRKYAKHRSALRRSADQLIGTIAGLLAAKLGVGAVIIAPLVAALLRMAVLIGLNAFCQQWDQRIPNP